MIDKIRKFCEDRDVSIFAFEKICGFSNGYISKLNKTKPGAKAALRIAQVMGVSVESLLSEEKESD